MYLNIKRFLLLQIVGLKFETKYERSIIMAVVYV